MAEKPYQPGKGTPKHFPHLGGALLLATAGVVGYIGFWESGSAEPVLTVYADKLAGGLPTVCDGITRHVTTTPIIVGQVWTVEKCRAESERALMAIQTQLAMCFKRLPAQTVFDMATSHAWNNGVRATCGSAAMRAWNVGDWALGCRRMAYSDGGKRVWSYVRQGKNPDGTPKFKFVQGLANRRADEYRNCLEATR
jgi:GH24 family phage-related lysozyme (muramidase)